MKLSWLWVFWMAPPLQTLLLWITSWSAWISRLLYTSQNLPQSTSQSTPPVLPYLSPLPPYHSLNHILQPGLHHPLLPSADPAFATTISKFPTTYPSCSSSYSALLYLALWQSPSPRTSTSRLPHPQSSLRGPISSRSSTAFTPPSFPAGFSGPVRHR
jgi:hypothetical protein